ncbi:MAG TPA: hypothetical protein VFH51_13540, partial [Myxococcota bacterium]|nr:hypothetical protein [Myxococcota bacterium]
SFWKVAKVFLERLSGKQRDTWAERLLTAAWDYSDKSRQLAWRTGYLQGSWAPCLATLARVARGPQRAEVTRLLEAIYYGPSTSASKRHEVAKISNDQAHHRTLWAEARRALGNGSYADIDSGLAETITRELYAHLDTEAFAALEEPAP